MTSPKISADKTSDSNAGTPKHQQTANAETPAPGGGGPSSVQAAVVATVESIRERGFSGYFSWLKVFRFANLMMKQGC